MMTTLAYIAAGFGLLRLVIATLNLLLQEKLPRPKSGESLPSLSVLIPARNEAHNIEALLSDLTHVESNVIAVSASSTPLDRPRVGWARTTPATYSLEKHGESTCFSLMPMLDLVLHS